MTPQEGARNREQAASIKRQLSNDRNFSITETAQWAGVSKPTVWRAIAAGELDAIKIGRRALTTPEGRASWKASWPNARASA